MPTGLYHRIKRNSGPIGELAALLKNADAVVVGGRFRPVRRRRAYVFRRTFYGKFP